MSKVSSAKYYQNNKEKLKKKSCGRYQSLFKEKKEKKVEYGREQYKNLPEDEKQKLVEYRVILKNNGLEKSFDGE